MKIPGVNLKLAFLTLTMVAASFSAATAAPRCNPSGSQTEMNICAEEEFKKADAELNKVYKKLIEQEKDDSVFIEKLRESQKAWLKFRDAELEATFACEDSALVCWGSMFPMCHDTYKAKITKDRTERLKKYLSDGRPADDCH